MRVSATPEEVASLVSPVVERYTLFVHDTVDYSLLRAGLWLTLRCEGTNREWCLRSARDGKVTEEPVILQLLIGLGRVGRYITECCPQIVASMFVTRLFSLDGRDATLVSWLHCGRHGMWATMHASLGVVAPSKYAACMHDIFPDAYRAAFSVEERAAHDFTPVIRDPAHPLCQYHRLKTLAQFGEELARAEYDSDDSESGE